MVPLDEPYTRDPWWSTRAAAEHLGISNVKDFVEQARSRERRRHDPPVMRVPASEMPWDADRRTALWYRDEIIRWGQERARRRARKATRDGGPFADWDETRDEIAAELLGQADQ